MKKVSLKSGMVMLIALLLCVVCAGCAKEISIQVIDGGNTTAISAKAKGTVGQALQDAGILLQEGDQTDPAADSALTEEITCITIKRLCKVTILSGEKDSTEVEVLGGTVRDALEQAGITLKKGQYTKEDAEEWLTDGMEIHLIQKLKVAVTADGKKQTVYTQAATVEELLKELKITLGDQDRVSPKLTAALDSKNCKVKVERVEVKKEVKTEKIAFEVKQTYSSDLDKGQSRVTAEGVNGEKKVTYQVTYVDGKEESRKVVKEETTKNPVSKVVTIGTRETKPVTTAPPATTKPATTKPATTKAPSGKTVVSKEKVYDCDGSGHGYYVITYSDGSVEYEDF